jgi:hypothetical protein
MGRMGRLLRAKNVILIEVQRTLTRSGRFVNDEWHPVKFLDIPDRIPYPRPTQRQAHISAESV